MALLGSLLWDSAAAIVLLFFVGYWYLTAKFNFFKKRGIPYVRPVPLFGNFAGVATGRESFMTATESLYKQLKKHPFGGVFMGRTPALVICDPELIKTVLTKDFSSFHDRMSITRSDEERDPMSVNLVNMPGVRWKNLRNKLSPTFTSGKLKIMFPLMKQCSKELSEYLTESALKGKDVDMHNILVRYTTDVIGTCAFGVECNSLKNENSEFYTMSRKIFKPSLIMSTLFVIISVARPLAKLFPFKRLFPGVQQFFIDLMRNTINYRKTNNVERSDFVQMMMQLLKNDEGKTKESHPDEVIITEDVTAAQAFIFFVAGLDFIAFTIGFALYHISIEPRLQEDLADEVISVINNHNGELTYEALKDMKLLERIIFESLRMNSAGGVLMRVVTNPNYIFPGTNLSLEKEMNVLIPVQGLHYDPDIFPDPSKFDPDRFTEEAASKRHPFTYMPFGEGPRVCIANRFALLESKLCLAALIKDFKFSVCSKTEIPLQLEPRSFGPKNGLYLKVEERT